MQRQFHLAFIALCWISHRSLAARETSSPAATAAVQEIQAGHFDAAKKTLEQGLRSTPKAAELWNLLGISETELHEPKAAAKAFQTGLQLAPNSVSLNENTGFLFFREANYGAAKRYLRRAVDLGSQKPGVRFSMAAAELRTGEQAKALAELQRLEPALGGTVDYWVERGHAELAENDPRAGRSFERALDLDSRNLEALNGAASAAEKQGLDEKALSYLIKARENHPSDVPTLLHFGTVCLRRDLGMDALDAAKKAYALEPANDYALFLLARANISQQQWQQAYDLFEQLAKRMTRYAPAYYAMGWLDIKLDKNEEARRQLQRALAIDPGLYDARAELAQIYLDTGELDAAEQSFAKVLQQDPKNAKANSGMGALMLRRGKLEEAQRCLEAAIASDPKDGAAHYKLSQVLLREHKNARAAEERSLALALNTEAMHASKTPLRLAMPDDSLPGSGYEDK